VTVEARRPGPSKQKSRIALWTYNLAKPGSLFVCFGQHINKRKERHLPFDIPYQNMRRGKKILPKESTINLTAVARHGRFLAVVHAACRGCHTIPSGALPCAMEFLSFVSTHPIGEPPMKMNDPYCPTLPIVS
jgi:hypothetical protein